MIMSNDQDYFDMFESISELTQTCAKFTNHCIGAKLTGGLAMKEDQWRDHITDKIVQENKCVITRMSQRNVYGTPDTHFNVYGGFHGWVEFKGAATILTPHQKRFVQSSNNMHKHCAFVWRQVNANVDLVDLQDHKATIPMIGTCVVDMPLHWRIVLDAMRFLQQNA